MSLLALSSLPPREESRASRACAERRSEILRGPRGAQAMVQGDDGAAFRYFAKQIKSVW
jgi:hypothetical protein